MEYKPLILVVEDNETNRDLLREILESEGYRVNEAENGQIGIINALKEIPDVILMDVEMPVMNGLDATQKLVDLPETARVPIIVLTGLNDSEERIKAFNCGAMDFVTKPFNTYELMARVKSYIRLSLLNKKYVSSTISLETGLPNRLAFREQLPEKIKSKLLLIKIDNFEMASRYYGDATGIGIEKDVAHFLQEAEPKEFKGHATLFHLGKGVFGFLLDDPDNRINGVNASMIIKGLIDRFNDYQSGIKETHHDIELTAVIGFNRENILEKCELALEEAIRCKTGMLIMDDIIKEVYHDIGENMFWLKKIREAVRHSRLIPYYQPIYNSTTNKIDKYESLVRLVDESGDVAEPSQFLAIAKNSRYYSDITRLMTQKSMTMFKERPEGFSLNLSALDIENPTQRDFLLETLRQNPDIASRMTLEIVEQEGVRYIEILKEFVKNVKWHGAKIAIDDFGAGYSNFKTLLDMNADYLKIDGSLILQVHKDPSCRNIVETIKAFADKTHIGVIAEFVENADIFTCLKNIGITLFQGYYIGKPQKL